MYWDNPGFTKKGIAQSQEGQLSPQVNQLVLNRGFNQAGIWYGGQLVVRANPLINPTADWQSPMFDLRPDLPFFSQGLQEGNPVYRNRTGDWGSLWVMVDGLNQQYPAGGPFGFQGLTVTYQEIVSPIDPSVVRRVNDPIDISAEFAVNTLLPVAVQKQAALLQFKPTDSVDPLRFWQVHLRFSWQTTFVTQGPQLRVQAAYY